MLAVASTLVLPRISLVASLESLLPTRAPEAEAYRRSLELFGGFEKIHVAVLASAPIEHPQALADELRVAFAAIEGIASVRLGLEPEDERFWTRETMPRALWLASDEQQQALLDRLEPEAVRRRAQRIRNLLRSPLGVDAADLIADPLGLAGLLPAADGGGGGLIDQDSGLFLGAEGKALLAVLEPNVSELDARAGRHIEAGLNAVADELSSRGLELVAAGGPLYAVQDERAMKADLERTISGSLLLCGLLLFAVFGDLRLPSVALGVVGVGLLWCAGAIALTEPRLLAVSLGFGAVLVGLGIDYAIHGGARARALALDGFEGSELGRRVLRSVGGGIAASAATTAAAFAVLQAAHFPPLAQLGRLVALGMLSILLATWLVGLPMVGQLKARSSRKTTPLWRLLAAAVSWSVEGSGRRPFVVLFLWGFALIAASPGVGALRIEADPSAFRPADHPAERAEKVLAESFGLGAETATLVIDGEDLEQTLGSCRELSSKLRLEMPELELSAPCDWLAAVPGDRLRADRGAAAAAIARVALADEGLRVSAFEPALASLAEPDRPPREGWPDWLQALVAEDGRRLAVSLRFDDPGDLPRVEAVIAGSIGVELAAASLVGRAIRRSATSDLMVLALLGLAVVGLVVLLSFRGRPGPAILSLTPVLAGCGLAFGLWGSFGRPLDLMSLAVLPMLLGIGIDDGLHAVHADRDPARGVNESGLAIALTSLTTAAAFASLLLSGLPGLRSAGALVSLGVMLCLLATITLVPALAVLAKRLSTRDLERQ